MKTEETEMNPHDQMDALNREMPGIVEQYEKAQTAVRDLVRKMALEVEQLTENQLATAIFQAIQCGDFVRQVRASDGAQNVIYIPYAREQELESRIERLEAALKQHGIEDPDN